MMRSVRYRRGVTHTGGLHAAAFGFALACCGPTQAIGALTSAGIELEVMGRYQMAIDAPAVANLPGGGSLSLRAEAGPGSSEPASFVGMVEGGIGEARSSLPGTFGTYANAGGVSPSYASGLAGLEGYARSLQVSHWMITSADPSITTATIGFGAFFHGTLYVGDYAGNNQANRLYASVIAGLAAETATGTVFDLTFNATLDEHTGLSASSNWASSFNSSSSTGTTGDKLYEVNYANVFANAFTVPVNVTFAWISELTSEAVAPGPTELFAQSNFFGTGSFELVTETPGTTLTLLTAPVPEPRLALLMLVGLVGVLAVRTIRLRRT